MARTRPAWLRLVFAAILMGIILFASAGRLDWYAAWGYIVLVVLFQARTTARLQRISPDLLEERRRMREGTKPWDKAIVPLIAIVLPAFTWALAGLDLRYAWSAPLPLPIQAAGFLLAAVSGWIAGRAMEENPFFAATVRIQTERGHRVISTGPYARVRHPGCVGMLGFTIAVPLMLGSAIAFVPAGICVALLILRTVLEDATLRAELTGYTDYARSVRWRLIPGLW